MNRTCITCGKETYYSNNNGRLKCFNKCYEHLMNSRQASSVMKFTLSNQANFSKLSDKINVFGYVIVRPDVFLCFLVENNLNVMFLNNSFEEHLRHYSTFVNLSTEVDIICMDKIIYVDITSLILEKTRERISSIWYCFLNYIFFLNLQY